MMNAINLDQGLARGVSLLARRCEEWGNDVRTFYAVFNGGNVARFFALVGRCCRCRVRRRIGIFTTG